MKAGKFFNGWTLLAVILVVIIITGGVVIGSKYGRGQPIEISLATAPELEGEIYIGGEVNNPGIYPFYTGDSLDEVLRAAGGVTGNADLSRIELIMFGKGEVAAPQKININTAEAWLLAALPGIGDVRARAIVDYRRENGPFRDVNELLKVAGIGNVTLENIRHLITVGD
jgi:competence protein ComEA